MDCLRLFSLLQMAQVFQNRFHLKETSNISIPHHTVPVDQEGPGGVIYSSLGASLHGQPNACHTSWTAWGLPVKNAQEARSTPRRSA